MSWIVIGEKKGKIQLVSKSHITGLIPQGAYLTIESKKGKHILRVDNSIQNETYSPSPLIIDMNLEGLKQDQKCQNIINAYRIKDLSNRDDGLVDFIHPQSIARRSNQKEIDEALGSMEKGPKVFIATIHYGQNQILIDEEKNYITAKLPEDMFFHQMLICGKTGSGKTVAIKYLSQYFVEDLEEGGAVLAINVKDIDLLQMDQPSRTNNKQIKLEWEKLNEKPKGIKNTTIYYPANTEINEIQNINYDICEKITLDVHTIEPEALTGLLTNISDIGAQNLPDVFRFWQSKKKSDKSNFNDFVEYFRNAENDNRVLPTLNIRGDESEIPFHKATYNNILRSLNPAIEFFDNEEALIIKEDDILQRGKLSVINLTGDKGIEFGSILLRHLLHRVVEAKRKKISDVPILIIIDEVHQFYNTNSS